MKKKYLKTTKTTKLGKYYNITTGIKRDYYIRDNNNYKSFTPIWQEFINIEQREEIIDSSIMLNLSVIHHYTAKAITRTCMFPYYYKRGVDIWEA